MREHELKTWPEPFAAVKSGAKPFEYRRNDRGFQVGDTLRLREWAPLWPPGEGEYTGDEIVRAVTFVLHGGLFGVPKGFCVLGLSRGGGDRASQDLSPSISGVRDGEAEPSAAIPNSKRTRL